MTRANHSAATQKEPRNMPTIAKLWGRTPFTQNDPDPYFRNTWTDHA